MPKIIAKQSKSKSPAKTVKKVAKVAKASKAKAPKKSAAKIPEFAKAYKREITAYKTPKD
jgi:hypothetical protein